jgi:hypothetical protein
MLGWQQNEATLLMCKFGILARSRPSIKLVIQFQWRASLSATNVRNTLKQQNQCTQISRHLSWSVMELKLQRLHLPSATLSLKYLFLKCFGLHDFSNLHWQQATLPIRLGGLGLVPPSLTAVDAFCASAAQFCYSNLQKLFPSLDMHLFFSSSSPLASAFASPLDTVDDYISSVTSVLPKSALQPQDDSQHRLAVWSNRVRYECMLSAAPKVAQVRLRSIDGSFLSAIPSRNDLRIPSYIVPHVLAMFLDAKLPGFKSLPPYCLCGKEIDVQGRHLQMCR